MKKTVVIAGSLQRAKDYIRYNKLSNHIPYRDNILLGQKDVICLFVQSWYDRKDRHAIIDFIKARGFEVAGNINKDLFKD